jgi:serine/threonine protein kinase
MEYLNGGDLYSMLRNLGCLDEDMARVYIAELVSILAFIVSLIYFVLFYFILTLSFSWLLHRFLHWSICMPTV